MPEQKIVSPLLDDLLIGAPLVSRNGISCSPAIKGNSDNRFIVKCICVPHTQSQVDALLITGALQDASAADGYFRERADEIFQEAELLRILARGEGFLPFDGCQYVPIGNDLPGYEVYLLSGYRLSLEKYMRRKGLTHLEAVNLGIDLCAALTASRRSGLMYIDLKPSNIFITPKKEYKIGDLGFAAMASLRYSSMPVKYRSPYTAPEVLDDMVVLNETVDTYAAGMLLYQIFNYGQLPADPKNLPAPANADEEISAILLKACAFSPADRYADPTELWNALIAYMQRNTINNTQIMPPLAPSDATGTIARFQINPLKKEEPEQPQEEAESVPETIEPAPAEQEEPESIVENEPEEEVQPEEVQPEEEAEPAEEAEPEEEEEDEELADDWTFDPLSEKKSSEKETSIESELEEVNRLLTASKPSMPKLKTKTATAPVVVKEKKKSGFLGFLKFLLIVLLLGGLSFGGWFYYQNYYLQSIDALTIEGTDNHLTVTVHSEIPDRMLTVACVDAYGAAVRENVHAGQASFSDLKPGSLYKIQVEISGLHQLTGQTSDIFTTETVTTISGFTAVTGAQDGELMLNLTVEGHEPDLWQLTYSSENTQVEKITFSGFNAAVTGLTLGETYHFELSCADGSPLHGQNTLDVLITGVITAQNLHVKSFADDTMEVAWDSHGENEALGWRARCYNDNGYDEIIEVSDPSAIFSGLDTTQEYTIEVTAEGMTQPTRITVSANPVTIKKINVDTSAHNTITLSWDCQGDAAQGLHWIVTYTIDGTPTEDIIQCEDTTASITPRIPGAVYEFTLQTQENVTLFNNVKEYKCPAADRFVGHGVSSYKMTSKLLPTPNPGWTYFGTPSSMYTDQFVPGQSISMVLAVSVNFFLDDVPVELMYVVRDEQGKVIPELTLYLEANWAHLWAKEDYHYAELNTTKAPTAPGKYTLDLYFDGGFVTSTPFTVS